MVELGHNYLHVLPMWSAIILKVCYDRLGFPLFLLPIQQCIYIYIWHLYSFIDEWENLLSLFHPSFFIALFSCCYCNMVLEQSWSCALLSSSIPLSSISFVLPISWKLQDLAILLKDLCHPLIDLPVMIRQIRFFFTILIIPDLSSFLSTWLEIITLHGVEPWQLHYLSRTNSDSLTDLSWNLMVMIWTFSILLGIAIWWSHGFWIPYLKKSLLA